MPWKTMDVRDQRVRFVVRLSLGRVPGALGFSFETWETTNLNPPRQLHCFGKERSVRARLIGSPATGPRRGGE